MLRSGCIRMEFSKYILYIPNCKNKKKHFAKCFVGGFVYLQDTSLEVYLYKCTWIFLIIIKHLRYDDAQSKAYPET